MSIMKALGLGAAETATKPLNGSDLGKIDSVATKQNPTRQPGWRARLPVHPAAELFPLMSEGELRELAADINKSGLQQRIHLYSDMQANKKYLLDGRNRLDALELLGKKIFDANGELLKEIVGTELAYAPPMSRPDCYAHVVSLNLARRHLTSEQKRHVIAELLKADPEKSNRQIAKTVGVDDKTVASVRADPRAEIPHVAKRTDTKGRKQPARRTKPKREPQGTHGGTAGEETQHDRSCQCPLCTSCPKDEKRSAYALVQFDVAVRHWLSRMNAVHRQEAVDNFPKIVASIGTG